MVEVDKKVSVVIPTYRRDLKYLSRAIGSVESQTYQNIEIVIVDDNEPDSYYRKQVSQYMQQTNNNEKLKYIANEKNLGGSLARNKGIDAAQGDYITFLDDDDEYLPDKVKRQLDFMLANDYDMSFTNLKLVNENKVVIDYREYQDMQTSDKDSLLKYHIMRHITGTPTFMYKTDKLRSIGGFEDSKMAQEFYLMFKTIEKGLSIGYLNECDVIAYRHKNGGISSGRNKINGENSLYSFKKKHFDIFTSKEKRFINYRHYAVMVIAYLRNKNYMHAVANCTKMVIASPVCFCSETVRYIKNLVKCRRSER